MHRVKLPVTQRKCTAREKYIEVKQGNACIAHWNKVRADDCKEEYAAVYNNISWTVGVFNTV